MSVYTHGETSSSSVFNYLYLTTIQQLRHEVVAQPHRYYSKVWEPSHTEHKWHAWGIHIQTIVRMVECRTWLKRKTSI